jgi:hypothetical protein
MFEPGFRSGDTIAKVAVDEPRRSNGIPSRTKIREGQMNKVV